MSDLFAPGPTSSRVVILDTETTGLSFASDRIVEIGLIEMVNRRVSGATFHTYVNPDMAIPPGATAIHGITDDRVAHEPMFPSIYPEMMAFIGDAEIVAHNASFDVGMLNAEIVRAGLGSPLDLTHRITDSLVLARKLHPGQRNTLDALCDRYGVSRANRTLHGALLDASLLANVYVSMTTGQTDLALRQASGPDGKRGFASLLGPCADIPLPVVAPAPEELETHRARMAYIAKKSGKDVWDGPTMA